MFLLELSQNHHLFLLHHQNCLFVINPMLNLFNFIITNDTHHLLDSYNYYLIIKVI
jgi:hypothetical protein